MNFPDNLRYTKDHEWVSLEGNVATVGITDFAQRELGDIVYIDISSKGKALGAEEVFGTVEAVKTVSDLFLPVAEMYGPPTTRHSVTPCSADRMRTVISGVWIEAISSQKRAAVIGSDDHQSSPISL